VITSRPAARAAPATPVTTAPLGSQHPSPATAPLSAVIEPDARMQPIYTLVSSAQRWVDLIMYELEDTHAEQLLAADADRGVDVRVILNAAYTGSANDPAFAYLQAHGVHVTWAGSRYALTHQKTLVVDGLVAVIMTLNWTSRYYSDTRDVAIIDRAPADVAAITTTFDADYSGAQVEPPAGVDLVWSPTTSLPGLLGLINGAIHELDVENEEMANAEVTAAIAAAARRGVNVELCMTASSSWATAFGELVAAGVHVRLYAPDAALYIHAKVIVRDPGARDEEAFVGSQNFSTESLRYNRELGIVLDGTTLIDQLRTMIQRDAGGAAPWSG
jgi:cardiolipin synthase A/B